MDPANNSSYGELSVKAHEPNYNLMVNYAVAWFVCAFGVVSNCLLLHVTTKCKGMFHAQHILAISDLLFCLTHFSAGPFRIYWEFHGMTHDQVSVLVVMLYPWPHFFNVGFWWPSFATLVFSLERFFASVYPIWYHNKWEEQVKVKFYRCVYVVMGCMLVPGYVAFIKTFVEKGTMVRHGGYYFMIDAIPYLRITQTNVGLVEAFLCAIFSTLALVLGRRKRAQLGLTNQTWVELDKKIERTVLVLLIAIPNLSLSLLNLLLDAGFGDKIPPWMIMLRRYVASFMILNSGLNFWLYLAFHSTFRAKASIHILGKGATVAPSNNVQVLPMVVHHGVTHDVA